MDAGRHDRVIKGVIAGFAALFFLAGAAWAVYGPDILISTVMAGLAYCF